MRVLAAQKPRRIMRRSGHLYSTAPHCFYKQARNIPEGLFQAHEAMLVIGTTRGRYHLRQHLLCSDLLRSLEQNLVHGNQIDCVSETAVKDVLTGKR